MDNSELKNKAEALMKKLTLDEKISMIHGAELFQTKGVERLGIPPLKMSDGPMGVRHEFEPDNWNPIGYTDDYVTYLPCNSALAATWNRELAYEMGSVLGEEARGRGKDVILAPGINIKRSPLCGRNFEYFSEDPFLTKELAVPYIEGVQLWNVAACVKHFAANNQETERIWIEVVIDEEALRKIYLPAFHDALVKANSYSVMGAYNLINGEHCCQSDFLLKKILRDEWNYDGVVISDWGGVHDTKLVAESQLDIEMSVTNDFDSYFMADPLKQKVQSGEISETHIDEKVTRILMLMMRLHMIDGIRKGGTYNTEEHRTKALSIARESVVLLKNTTNHLPLSITDTKRVLIIGDNAESIHSKGGGSAEIKALYEISPLMGIKSLLGGNTEVIFARGYGKDENQITTLRKEAVTLAAEHDTVIFVGGLNHNQDCEGNDKTDMKLPYEQDALIKELLSINPNTIIILTGGSSVEMSSWIDKANTIVWGWYAGMEGGRALAEVIFGITNPSGKLPETFYKKLTDCSAHCLGEFPGDKKVHYKEGIFVGYRYNDTFNIEPQFPFGHGLSYTEFVYATPALKNNGEHYFVECDIINVGKYEGLETVQVYLSLKERRENQELQELKGFEKVRLLPTEKKRVKIRIEDYNETYEVRIGSSSRDIKLKL